MSDIDNNISFGVYQDKQYYKDQNQAMSIFASHQKTMKKIIEHRLKDKKMLSKAGQKYIKEWAEKLTQLYSNVNNNNALISAVKAEKEVQKDKMIEKLEENFSRYFNEILNNGKLVSPTTSGGENGKIEKEQRKLEEIIVKMGHLINAFESTFPNANNSPSYHISTIKNFMKDFSADIQEIQNSLTSVNPDWKFLIDLPEKNFNQAFFNNINPFIDEINSLIKYENNTDAEDFLNYIKKQKAGTWAGLKGEAGELLVGWLEYYKDEIDEKIKTATAKEIAQMGDILKKSVVIGEKGSGYGVNISFGEGSSLNAVALEGYRKEKINQLKKAESRTQSSEKQDKIQDQIRKLQNTGVVTVDATMDGLNNDLSTNVTSSQDKIDVIIDFKKLLDYSDAEDKAMKNKRGSVRGASIKHYASASGIMDAHLQKVNLLRSIYNAGQPFMYHWFNLKNLDSGSAELEVGNKALELQMAYEALAHGTIYKQSPDAELFIGIDSTTKKIFVKDTYTILNKTLLASNMALKGVNITFNPTLQSIDFTSLDYYKIAKTELVELDWYERIARARAAAFVGQAKAWNIQVSLAVDMNNAEGVYENP